MKILLDECLPLDFRHSFRSHDAHSAEWAGFKGKKNGELLRDAELAGYDVLVTVDQGISRQQKLIDRKLGYYDPLPNKSDRGLVAVCGCHFGRARNDYPWPNRSCSITLHQYPGLSLLIVMHFLLDILQQLFPLCPIAS